MWSKLAKIFKQGENAGALLANKDTEAIAIEVEALEDRFVLSLMGALSQSPLPDQSFDFRTNGANNSFNSASGADFFAVEHHEGIKGSLILPTNSTKDGSFSNDSSSQINKLSSHNASNNNTVETSNIFTKKYDLSHYGVRFKENVTKTVSVNSNDEDNSISDSSQVLVGDVNVNLPRHQNNDASLTLNHIDAEYRSTVYNHDDSTNVNPAKWYAENYDTITIKYDFRDLNGYSNQITVEQQELIQKALDAWTTASGNKVQYVRDTSSASEDIVVIGVGDLAALGLSSETGGDLAATGIAQREGTETPQLIGLVWLDSAEKWENNYLNGDVQGTVDFFTVFAHEAGHLTGLEDLFPLKEDALMNIDYQGEKGIGTINSAFDNAVYMKVDTVSQSGMTGLSLRSMLLGDPQLTTTEVQNLLKYGSQVSVSDDAIIAIVDRNGNILGVRAEQQVLTTFAGNPTGLAFAVDGAVAKARTAAFFSNGDEFYNPQLDSFAPITSRLVQFISQSTITQREVESNPNITNTMSTERGPGFVAPIGLGGHFPPEIPNTPPVDLFAIEHTNRDSIRHPGADRIKGTADDVTLRGRFNIDPAFVDAGQQIAPPESYGRITGINPGAQSRGIATLPGGVPIFRDTNNDGVGDTLIGAVGVFFPGIDGYATHEQNFIPGIGQTQDDRLNAPKVLEAELIAFAVAGGSLSGAQFADDIRAKSLTVDNPVKDIDIPFGRLDLVGVQLSALGPTAGREGVDQTIALGEATQSGLASGMDLDISTDEDMNNNGLLDAGEVDLDGDSILDTAPEKYRAGASVPDEYLVNAHGSAVNNISAADVTQIINNAIDASKRTRAAIRIDSSDGGPGVRTRMVIAVTDTTGEVLGLYRMEDATVFSVDVAVAKARNVAYYADELAIQDIDRVEHNDGGNPNDLVAKGTAFSNRTFRFLAEPRYPSGSDFSKPPQFSILNDPGINKFTAENLGAALPASVYTSVLGNDSFNPGTNFRDLGDAGVMAATGPSNNANQNGIVFFPGSTPLYKNGELIGGLGVSGDGVDQDDVVTFLAAQGFLPDGITIGRADQNYVDEVRLPFQKFLRNPFG